ncbi:MAG: kinase [Clostridia bacterium]|nr:kinase [Clostridia bacterium]
MIISKTPFRMSFFGGGSDVEDFFREHGGSVISTTFNKYCFVTVRKLPGFFDYKSHLTYSKSEFVSSLDEIRHPAIRNAMKMLDISSIRLTYDADLPARSGLGTSSSFAVGMLNAFYALNGIKADKKLLAEKAIYLERVLCEEAGGWQDQIAAAYGGFNKIVFSDMGFEVTPVPVSPFRKRLLSENLMLFFTGFTRFSADVHTSNGSLNREKIRVLERILALCGDAEKVLVDEDADLDEFGQLLDEEWKLKRMTGSNVSTDAVDDLYRRGISAGALGGKLLGAGGGGFLLFYVTPEKQSAVREALKDLLYVPFSFEDNGSCIIFNSDDSESEKEIVP